MRPKRENDKKIESDSKYTVLIKKNKCNLRCQCTRLTIQILDSDIPGTNHEGDVSIFRQICDSSL